jgi:hypothetical protein
MHIEGYNAIRDVLTTLNMNVGVLWCVAPCSWITSSSDGGIVLICMVEEFPLTIEPLLHSETFVLISRAACRHISYNNKGEP